MYVFRDERRGEGGYTLCDVRTVVVCFHAARLV